MLTVSDVDSDKEYTIEQCIICLATYRTNCNSICKQCNVSICSGCLREYEVIQKKQNTYVCPHCRTNLLSDKKITKIPNVNLKTIAQRFRNWKNTNLSIKIIEKTTRPCPWCKVRIEKNGGCYRMRCYNCKKKFKWNKNT